MIFRLLFIIIFISKTSFSQDHSSAINNFFNHESEKLEFDRGDVNDFKIRDISYSKSMDLNLVYIQQQYQGVPIHNAIGTFAIKNNKVQNFNHSFTRNLNQKIQNTTHNVTASSAITTALNYLEIEQVNDLELIESKSSTSFIFKSETASVEVIPVELMYVLNADKKLRLAWNLSLLTSDESHWWSISVDANSSEVIRQNDWMLSCSFDSNHDHGNNYFYANAGQESETLANINDGSAYRAYPLGVESPNHGNRILLNEPADPTASPFGWHDTDGMIGPEFTITRGNNVLASEDRNADNVPGYSPDGGSNLNFDFPLNPNTPPQFNQDAAITNLFVWNNFTHDVWFHYGFDELSGNFQAFNYSGLGAGGDFVVADAQDGGGINNANFGTPPDGFNPRMQMFLWSASGPPSDPLTINSPSDIAGSYSGLEAVFGPGLSHIPVTADLILVEDDNTTSSSGDPYDACDPLINTSDINGKIAVINRGDCTFVSKIEKAQNAGALAVIMINNVFGNPINMGGITDAINIPSIMISLTDGASIITKLQNNETINATLVNNGPYQVDGDYDNGIIAHEYGHGISNRLTGGPSQADCLFNDEQMGEGWSDWIGLMMTMQTGDTGEQARGYGTFAISQPTTGNGIRPAPYSTDNNINLATFGISNNPNISQPHGVGFVWATILWDLTWELIDQYGFDPDLINGNGGNNLAMQLVTDGMKLQNCNPGFVNGRDAILQADMLANNGANQCFIWKVFANRGLGFSADQGSAFDRFDQTEAFDLPTSITLPCQTLANDNFLENRLKIYPNPANTVVNIDGLSDIGNANLKIYDLNGRLLMNNALDMSNDHTIDISQFERGIYILKIESTRVHFSKKLIVN
jgi:hypothetical protein